MKKNIVKISLVTAMLLTTGAYSAQIVGATPTDPVGPPDTLEQFGFGGLNLENVTVNMVTGTNPITGVPNDPIVGTFDPLTGVYPQMAFGDSYQSSVFSTDDNKSDEATRLGYITQKIWPISEPTGIKVINSDGAVSNNKPENCIMASSYLGDSNTSDPLTTTHYLNDPEPSPVLCSSYAGSSKRFQLIVNENMVAGANPGEYGESIDLVFDIASPDSDHRYQVFQKVTNHTGMRLDGFTIEVLDSTGEVNPALTLSLGEGEKLDKDGIFDPTDPDLWPDYEYAFYPPGLWGDGTKKHLEKGWFDIEPAGFNASLSADEYIITSGSRLPGNYVELFGDWQPEKWVPRGMHKVIDPLLGEPILIAYWGTTPTETFNDAPNWHYGMDHDLSDGDQSFAIPSDDVLAMWAANPADYVIDDIEDIPNVSMNYIINVGAGIDSNITIRITPKVSLNQDAPSYISKDDNITYIEPVLPDAGTDTATSGGGGGGGCTYNPNSKNFDMTFLMMMALGLLYPFRRRFLK